MIAKKLKKIRGDKFFLHTHNYSGLPPKLIILLSIICDFLGVAETLLHAHYEIQCNTHRQRYVMRGQR